MLRILLCLFRWSMIWEVVSAMRLRQKARHVLASHRDAQRLAVNESSSATYTPPERWARHLGQATFIREGGESKVFRVATTCGQDVAIKQSKKLMSKSSCETLHREASIQNLITETSDSVTPVLAITPCPEDDAKVHVDMMLELYDMDLKDLMRTPEVRLRKVAMKLGDQDASTDVWRLWLSAAKDVMEALDATHANGYIHRDIKARNVLVRSLDQSQSVGAACLAGLCRYYVADFGTACKPGGDGDCSYVMATLGYMPPEVNKVNSKNEDLTYSKVINKAQDYWALGLTLWELWACWEGSGKLMENEDQVDDFWFQTPGLPITRGPVSSMEMATLDVGKQLFEQSSAQWKKWWNPPIAPTDIQNVINALLDPRQANRLAKWIPAKEAVDTRMQVRGIRLPQAPQRHCMRDELDS